MNAAGKNWSGGIILWDVTTGKLAVELSTDGVGVRWVTVSTDGKYVAGGGPTRG